MNEPILTYQDGVYRFEYLHYENNGINLTIPATWTEAANRAVIQAGSYANLDTIVNQLAGKQILEADAETFAIATNGGPNLYIDKTQMILGDGLAPTADFINALGRIKLTGTQVMPSSVSAFFNLSVIVSFDPAFVAPGAYTYDIWHHFVVTYKDPSKAM